MVIIKRISSKATVGKLKNYLIQEEKTEEIQKDAVFAFSKYILNKL